MASKTKEKLKKKQIKSDGRIIDIERFAYDVCKYSVLKFGIPGECICEWKGNENDYGHSDFIAVMSRLPVKCQITHRYYWYKDFKRCYDETKFKSFRNISTLLQRMFYQLTHASFEFSLYELNLNLAAISELILFLYTENCDLYLKNLAKFFFEYWCPRKKELERDGGLASIYNKFNSEAEVKAHVFYSEFIPTHCIPYSGSGTLREVFEEEHEKFFGVTSDALAEEGMNFLNNSIQAMENLIRLTEACETSERDEASGIDTLTNTGLGIPSHEDLLRDMGVLNDNPATSSSQDIQSANRQKPGHHRGSSGQKKGQKKK